MTSVESYIKSGVRFYSFLFCLFALSWWLEFPQGLCAHVGLIYNFTLCNLTSSVGSRDFVRNQKREGFWAGLKFCPFFNVLEFWQLLGVNQHKELINLANLKFCSMLMSNSLETQGFLEQIRADFP